MLKKIFQALAALVLLVFAVVVAAVFFRPNQILSNSEARKVLTLPSSHFINWRGADIHYTDEGKGPNVLMIHGFGGSYRNFDSLANLMSSDFRVVRVDLPGFGLSDFPQVTEQEDFIADYREYLSFIIDTLHLDSVCVIGNSMGGGMAWMMAVDHPQKVSKLVLLNSAGYDTKAVAEKLAMFKYKSVGKIFERGMPMFMSKGGVEKCFADHSKIDPAMAIINNKFSNREGNLNHMLNLARAKQFPDSALIKKVACPTLIVWGKQDEIIPVEHSTRFKRDIANSKLVVYDPCGHVPMTECSHDLNRDIRQFLSE